MYFLRARYYQQNAGRFICQDPLDGTVDLPSSLHRYRYCDNEPINRIDPLGASDLASSFYAMTLGRFLQGLAPIGSAAIRAQLYGTLGRIISKTILTTFYAIPLGVTAVGVIAGATQPGQEEDAMPVYVLKWDGIPQYIDIKQPDFKALVRTSISVAIGRGRPTVLSYDEPDEPTKKARRDAAYRANGVQPGRRSPIYPIVALAVPPGVAGNWDEYPFASTREGGANSLVTLVSANENKRQGTDFKQFIQDVLRPYYVRKGQTNARINPYRFRVVIE